jgi:hypothetical protein
MIVSNVAHAVAASLVRFNFLDNILGRIAIIAVKRLLRGGPRVSAMKMAALLL